MNGGRGVLAVCVAVVLGWSAGTVRGSIPVDTVTVGDPGNWAEMSGYGIGPYGSGPPRLCGAVSYQYNIGKYEVTAGQYTAFLNAVAATDTYGLYSNSMWPNDYGCKIQQSGSAGSYTYSVAPERADRPVNFVSWGDAVRFANWMHNGQPTGQQTLSTTEDGSYYLNGASTDAALSAVTRKTNATWAIPTEDEWYKAAYYKGGSTNAGYWDYPTSSDTVPGRDLADGLGNNPTTIPPAARIRSTPRTTQLSRESSRRLPAPMGRSIRVGM